MKPYLAIIKDSFREALASRVLWILVILITVVLAGLAPFSFTTELTYRLADRDLWRVAELVDRLGKKKLLARDPVAEHVAGRLSDDLRTRLAEARQRGENAPLHRLRWELLKELTTQMEQDDFYQPAIWQGIDLGDEGNRLAALGTGRTTEQTRRLHRLALEAAFPNNIRPASNESAMFTYAGFDLGLPRFPKKNVHDLIRDSVSGFTYVFVGQIGVFVAVLVTASIIPNTFDAGSVLLLLSKPISRPLLYLAKFLGGCSFVLINAAYLVTGLWLLVGLRLGVWQHRLLLCIPVFLFLFAIYYSVSGLAGLVWRNTIICIAVTVLFWFVCSLVGTAKFMVDSFVHEPNRVNRLISLDDELFATTNGHAVLRWDSRESNWQELSAGRSLFGGPMSRNTSGHIVADTAHQRLVTVRGSQLAVRTADANWDETDVGSLPEAARAVVQEPDGRVLAVTSSKMYRLGDELKTAEPLPSVFGFEIPIPRSESNYQVVDIDLSEVGRGDFAVSANMARETLVFWHNGKLTTFQRAGTGYTRRQQRTCQESHQNAIVGAAGDLIVLALDDGQIQTFDHNSLELRQSYQPFRHNQPRFIAAAPDGAYFAVVFHSGQLWLLDGRTGEPCQPSMLRGKNIASARFTTSTRLLVSERGRRVRLIDLPSDTVVQTWRSPRTLMESVSRFAIDPIYTVFPKPGRLDETVRYLMTGRETVEMNSFDADLAGSQMRLDPWSPVYSSLAFMVVVLIVSCAYISRQEY